MEQVCGSASGASFNWRTLVGAWLHILRGVRTGSSWTTDWALCFWKGSYVQVPVMSWFFRFGDVGARLWFQVQLEVKVLFSAYAWAAWPALLVCCLWKVTQHLLKQNRNILRWFCNYTISQRVSGISYYDLILWTTSIPSGISQWCWWSPVFYIVTPDIVCLFLLIYALKCTTNTLSIPLWTLKNITGIDFFKHFLLLCYLWVWIQGVSCLLCKGVFFVTHPKATSQCLCYLT